MPIMKQPNIVTAIKKRHKWTDQELADRVGVNASSIWRWEHGKMKIGGPAQRLLASMLENEAAQ